MTEVQQLSRKWPIWGNFKIFEGSGVEPLTVEDDGCGLVPDTAIPVGVASHHLGVLGMRERLLLVNGSLEIESSPGQGTTLYARVPI